MSPIEQAGRAACVHMGIDPDKWTAFRDIGEAAINGFIEALPDDLQASVRSHLSATEA